MQHYVQHNPGVTDEHGVTIGCDSSKPYRHADRETCWSRVTPRLLTVDAGCTGVPDTEND